MGISNFKKNALQDLIYRGQGFTFAGVSVSLSGMPTLYVSLIGGSAHFPNQGACLRSTDYEAGDYAWPPVTNGRLYKCTKAGTTGITEPVWTEGDGGTVTDGSVVWTEQSVAMAEGDMPEPVGNDYERQPWVCSMANVMGCNLANSAGPSSGPTGIIANLPQIQFPMAVPDEWGPVWGFALWDAAVDGNLLDFAGAAIPKVVGANDQIALAGGVPNNTYGAARIILEG